MGRVNGAHQEPDCKVSPLYRRPFWAARRIENWSRRTLHPVHITGTAQTIQPPLGHKGIYGSRPTGNGGFYSTGRPIKYYLPSMSHGDVLTIGKGRHAVSAGSAVGIPAALCATTSN